MGAKASRSQFYPRHSLTAQRRCEPFRDAEEAWLWTMAALMARREGARYTANQGRVVRPCEPDDVVKCLDGLYRQRRIDLVHARDPAHLGRATGRAEPALFRTSAATGGCGERRWNGSNGRCG